MFRIGEVLTRLQQSRLYDCGVDVTLTVFDKPPVSTNSFQHLRRIPIRYI